MELDVFARVHARKGQEDALAGVLVAHLSEVRSAPGCLSIHDYRSLRDPALLYIHSRWVDQGSFERYARLPSTDRFVERVEGRMDDTPLQAARTTSLEAGTTVDAPPGALYVFAPFHASVGNESPVAATLRQVHGPTASEPGCLMHQLYRSTRDGQLFYVHSVWLNEATFDRHVQLPHTLRFAELIEGLIDHQLEVTRAREIG